jgi:hypothetical protein
MPGKAAVTIDKRDFDAAIFDLDGVLTDTAGIHAAAWKIVFDAFLKRQFRQFVIDVDYLAYVDGQPRYDGVRTFLSARSIVLWKAESMTPKTPKRSVRSAIGVRGAGSAPNGELPSDHTQTGAIERRSCQRESPPLVILPPRAQASRRCETQAPLSGKPPSCASVSVP